MTLRSAIAPLSLLSLAGLLSCGSEPSDNGSTGAGGASASTSTSSASSAGSTGSTGSTGSSSGAGGGSASPIGPMGGTLDQLSFAIVGDTRPPTIDDTAGYPTAVISKIWSDVEAHSPRPPFAVTTGDYIFASTNGTQVGPQFDRYITARTTFSNITFPAMGNHECTGATASNCGPGAVDGSTQNYTEFMKRMITPLGVNTPYYVIHINGKNNAWTAKFVFLAPNAWTPTQDAWLSTALAEKTTYTFIIRHERGSVTTTPGIPPSNTTIAKFPYTIQIEGHTHTYEHDAQYREIIVGNGGAPLTGAIDYGYVIATQRADGAIEFKEYDYNTNTVHDTFAVKADGSPAP